MSDILHPITSGLLFDDMEITCVMDGYEPRLAKIVTETISEIRDESVFTIIFDLWCDAARESITRN